jgi:hypothetical protein
MEAAVMRQVEVREHAERLGHVLHRDDRRRGRWSVICTRCGNRAEARARGLVGSLTAGKCFPDPEEGLEALEALTAISAAEEAIWAVRAARAFAGTWGAQEGLATVHRLPCPTCSGAVRETVGMVCRTCGTDYGPRA